MTLCTSIDTLAMTYLDDELAEEELRDFELHLLDCAACRGRVDGEREALAELRRRLAPPPTPDVVRARLRAALDTEDAAVASQSWLRQWALPGAASIAAVAALVVFVAFRAPDDRRPSAASVVAGQQMRSAQVLTPEVVVAGAPGSERHLSLQRSAKYDRRVAGIDVTTLEYYVDLPSGIRVLALATMFDARRVDMRVGDHVMASGFDLWVDDQGGKSIVTYEGARGGGYVFEAPQLSRDDLIWLVANYLIDDVGAR